MMRCPACQQADLQEFFHAERMPVFCNVLWPTRAEAAAAPCADIDLGWCRRCQFIYNTAFDPGLIKYDVGYENPLHFSATFRNYADELADRLVERHDLHDKDIVEIGCSDGRFLAALCRKGDNRGVGFDPSYDPASSAGRDDEQITIVPAYFSPDSASRPVDFVCCRHVLEHVDKPLEFLRNVRNTLGAARPTPVYFELPNALYMLINHAVWDILYEHCGYFTPSALANIFGQAGFDVLDVREVYGEQFVSIEAAPADGDSFQPALETDPEASDLIVAFADEHAEYVAAWHRKLGQMAGQYDRPVIWGAGSKGATFLNTLHVSTDQIAHVVDVNPNKADRFIPRTAQRIVQPEYLRQYRPDAVIAMNPIYRDEIRQTLDQLEIEAEVMTA